MYECPKCQSDNLAVNAISHVTAYINRCGDVIDDKGGDLWWDGGSEMRCCDCQHTSTVDEFLSDEGE